MYALVGRPDYHDSMILRRLIDPKERAFHREIANDPACDIETREFWETYAIRRELTQWCIETSPPYFNLVRPPFSEIFSIHSVSFHREFNERSRIVLLDLSNFRRDGRRKDHRSTYYCHCSADYVETRQIWMNKTISPTSCTSMNSKTLRIPNERSIGEMAEQLRKYSFWAYPHDLVHV